jgi:hypothetical protein
MIPRVSDFNVFVFILESLMQLNRKTIKNNVCFCNLVALNLINGSSKKNEISSYST